jgi:arsenate reductase
MNDPIRVLFLCTHNSARSQIAEALLHHLGGEDFAAFSAGTEVTGVHPLALAVLHESGIATEGLRSKHLREFAGQQFHVVVTVCDRARDACPLFPGAATQLHWSFPDPSAVEGTDEERLPAFRSVREGLTVRLIPFIAAQREKRQAITPQSG